MPAEGNSLHRFTIAIPVTGMWRTGTKVQVISMFRPARGKTRMASRN
jgi:hypothetical protein